MNEKLDYKALGEGLGRPWDILLGNLEHRLLGNGINSEHISAAVQHIVYRIVETEKNFRKELAEINPKFNDETIRKEQEKLLSKKNDSAEAIRKRIVEVFDTPQKKLSEKMEQPPMDAMDELLHEMRVSRVIDACRDKTENEVLRFAREACQNGDYTTFSALTGGTGPVALLHPEHVARVREEWKQINFPAVSAEISQWKRAGEIASELLDKLE